MTSATRVPKAELTGLSGYIVKRISKKMFGAVPEPAEVLWHNRKVLNSMMGLGWRVQKWDALAPDLASFAHMAVASMVGCSWCLDLHYFSAVNDGLDQCKASEVPRWHESTVFTPLEREVMEYAKAMTQTPPTVTDAMSLRLLDRLGAPAMVELTSIVAFANMSTRSNSALGISSQGFSDACELPLARRSTGDVSST